MKKSWQVLFVFGSLGMGLVACDMKKQLTEMHDSTARLETNTREMGETTKSMDQTTLSMYDVTKLMAKTTQSMHETTNVMSSTTNGMSIMTNELVDLARMNDSSAQRRDALQALKTADSLGLKVNEAAKFLSSFEFQLFNGIGQDAGKEKRMELQNQAVIEFFKSVKEFDSGRVVTKAMVNAKGGDEDNNDLSFNAMAAALHIVNRKQLEYLKNNKLDEKEKVSMLGLIVSSLEKKEAINKGDIRPEDIPEYTKEVLTNERIALRLLQARATVFAAIACVEMSLLKTWSTAKKASATKIDDSSSLIKAGAKALVKSVKMFSEHAAEQVDPRWSLDVEKFNVVQLQYYIKLMSEFTEVRNRLEKLGVVYTPDEDLSRFLKNMDCVEAKSEASGPLLQVRGKFKGVLDQFVISHQQ